MDGTMGRWRDVSDWLSAGGGYTQGQIALCCSVILQAGVWRPRRDMYQYQHAQLWRCPVTWCTVWKGTAQDCVDHLRKTHHAISQTMKAANLARHFPPWTVTRSQWSEMTRPAISGVAIDTLLFSRIGVPLFHRYRIVSRGGTHVALRGTYMRLLHAFLEEMDEEWILRLHRRRAQEMVTRMSLSSGRDSADGSADVSSRHAVARRTVSRARRPRKPVRGAGSSCASDMVSLPPAEAYTVQALMDLALPRFAGLGDGPRQVHAPWAMSTDSPASPATSHLDQTWGQFNSGIGIDGQFQFRNWNWNCFLKIKGNWNWNWN